VSQHDVSSLALGFAVDEPKQHEELHGKPRIIHHLSSSCAGVCGAGSDRGDARGDDHAAGAVQ
jgi:hypothetical protein